MRAFVIGVVLAGQLGCNLSQYYVSREAFDEARRRVAHGEKARDSETPRLAVPADRNADGEHVHLMADYLPASRPKSATVRINRGNAALGNVGMVAIVLGASVLIVGAGLYGAAADKQRTDPFAGLILMPAAVTMGAGAALFLGGLAMGIVAGKRAPIEVAPDLSGVIYLKPTANPVDVDQFRRADQVEPSDPGRMISH